VENQRERACKPAQIDGAHSAAHAEAGGGIGHAYFYFTTTSFAFKKTHFFRLKSQIKS
jgi:hypothetical protein